MKHGLHTQSWHFVLSIILTPGIGWRTNEASDLSAKTDLLSTSSARNGGTSCPSYHIPWRFPAFRIPRLSFWPPSPSSNGGQQLDSCTDLDQISRAQQPAILKDNESPRQFLLGSISHELTETRIGPS